MPPKGTTTNSSARPFLLLSINTTTTAAAFRRNRNEEATRGWETLLKRGKFSLSKFPLRNCFRNWIRKKFLVEAEFSSVASPGQSTAVGRESREDKKSRQTVCEEEEVEGGGGEGGLFRAAKNKANRVNNSLLD